MEQSDYIRNKYRTRNGDNNSDNNKKYERRGRRNILPKKTTNKPPKKTTNKSPKKIRNKSSSDAYSENQSIISDMRSFHNTSLIDTARDLSSCAASSHELSYTSSFNHNCFPRLDELVNKNDFIFCYEEVKKKVHEQDIGNIKCTGYQNFKPKHEKSGNNREKGNEKSPIDYVKILKAKGKEYSRRTILDDDVSEITSRVPIELENDNRGEFQSEYESDQENRVTRKSIRQSRRNSFTKMSIPLEHWGCKKTVHQKTLIPLGNKARVEMTVNTPQQVESRRSFSPSKKRAIDLIKKVHSGVSRSGASRSRTRESSTPRRSGLRSTTPKTSGPSRNGVKDTSGTTTVKTVNKKNRNKTNRGRSAKRGTRGVVSEKTTILGNGVRTDRVWSPSPVRNRTHSKGRSVTPIENNLHERSRKPATNKNLRNNRPELPLSYHTNARNDYYSYPAVHIKKIT